LEKKQLYIAAPMFLEQSQSDLWDTGGIGPDIMLS
jgi:hypothetical protein